jgi:hypothetical protein
LKQRRISIRLVAAHFVEMIESDVACTHYMSVSVSILKQSVMALHYMPIELEHTVGCETSHPSF